MKRQRERGAIALLTLSFLVTIAAAVLVFLWGTARTTGAFNALYAANQAAAYAAVTATKTQGGSSVISCNNFAALGARCISSSPGTRDALRAAEATLQSTFPAAEQGKNFGLCYAPSWNPGQCTGNRIKLKVNPSHAEHAAIRVINIPPPANSSQSLDRRSTCQTEFSNSSAAVSVIRRSGNPICFFLREYGNSYGINYNSGVVTRSVAEIEYIPGCTSSICPKATISVFGAAVQDQPIPGLAY